MADCLCDLLVFLDLWKEYQPKTDEKKTNVINQMDGFEVKCRIVPSLRNSICETFKDLRTRVQLRIAFQTHPPNRIIHVPFQSHLSLYFSTRSL